MFYSYQMLELEQRGLEDMCTNLIKDLNEYGVCVLDNFLGYDKGLQVLREVNDMYNDGIFKVINKLYLFIKKRTGNLYNKSSSVAYVQIHKLHVNK